MKTNRFETWLTECSLKFDLAIRNLRKRNEEVAANHNDQPFDIPLPPKEIGWKSKKFSKILFESGKEMQDFEPFLVDVDEVCRLVNGKYQLKEAERLNTALNFLNRMEICLS